MTGPDMSVRFPFHKPKFSKRVASREVILCTTFTATSKANLSQSPRCMPVAGDEPAYCALVQISAVVSPCAKAP